MAANGKGMEHDFRYGFDCFSLEMKHALAIHGKLKTKNMPLLRPLTAPYPDKSSFTFTATNCMI